MDKEHGQEGRRDQRHRYKRSNNAALKFETTDRFLLLLPNPFAINRKERKRLFPLRPRIATAIVTSKKEEFENLPCFIQHIFHENGDLARDIPRSGYTWSKEMNAWEVFIEIGEKRRRGFFDASENSKILGISRGLDKNYRPEVAVVEQIK